MILTHLTNVLKFTKKTNHSEEEVCKYLDLMIKLENFMLKVAFKNYFSNYDKDL